MKKEEKKLNKEWTYHVNYTFYDNTEKQEHSIATQLYQVGVYLIQDNNPNLWFNLTPEDMVKSEIELKILVKKGEILDLQFGREITVIQDKDGMYIEKPKIITNAEDLITDKEYKNHRINNEGRVPTKPIIKYGK